MLSVQSFGASPVRFSASQSNNSWRNKLDNNLKAEHTQFPQTQNDRAVKVLVMLKDGFTPTIDAVARLANSRAALPLDVKIDVALALGCAYIILNASSRSFAGDTVATGPKISSVAIVIPGFT